MELLKILHALWARRFMVGLGLVASLAIAALGIRGAPPATITWVASARVLIDTSDSQLVNVLPLAVETLPLRAELAADAVATDRLKAQVARDVGIRADELDIIAPAAWAEPPVSDELVSQAVKFAGQTRAPYVVSLYADGLSPIVSIGANAPDARRATMLANATIAVLKASIAPPVGSRGFVTETVTAPHAAALVHRSRHALFALVGAIAVFVLWCTAVLLASGLRRRVRGAQPA
jgi:hypothetical protein